jgi:hypothetical protein
LPGKQTTQKPAGSLQTGSPLVQFASVVQPSVQVLVFVLHTPFGPVHCVLFTHWTHSLAAVSQTGVEPVHAELSEAEHSTHWPDLVPDVMHAGSTAVKHAWLAPEPRLPLQFTHRPFGTSQTGLAPEHCAFVVHSTQVLVFGLHAVAPAPH